MDLMHQARQRTIDRWPYFCWGLGLMVIKYNIDRLIAGFGFHRSWYFWNYIKPHDYAAVRAIPAGDQSFYFLLLLTSLPFLIAGLVLTIWRLRSARLPLVWCILFFIPVLNLIFFIVLSAVPAADIPVRETGLSWNRWLPASKVGSALLTVLIVSVLGSALAAFSSQYLANYGWGLFVANPFVMGMLAVFLYEGADRRSFGSCMFVAILPVLFSGIILLAMAVEGVICLAMALPIALVLALLGGAIGYLIVPRPPTGIDAVAMILLFFSVPFLMGMEKQADVSPPLLSVCSRVVVNAPIEKVWSNVIAFPPIPEKREWILQTGVAYPIRAKIEGHGVGAIRHCIFNSGEFVEPIEVWEEPHLLRFSVGKQPEPMQELSPYRNIKPPHLNNYLLSRRGEFKLTEISRNQTLLEGTTWYTDEMWPDFYWQMWSDTMIHHIHLRVLNHIKDLCENPV